MITMSFSRKSNVESTSIIIYIKVFFYSFSQYSIIKSNVNRKQGVKKCDRNSQSEHFPIMYNTSLFIIILSVFFTIWRYITNMNLFKMKIAIWHSFIFFSMFTFDLLGKCESLWCSENRSYFLSCIYSWNSCKYFENFKTIMLT